MMEGSGDGFDTMKNLIVNYLPPNFSQDDIKMMFSRIGPVSNCKLIRNRENGQSLGYAFIEYPDERLAAEAISQIDGVKLQGKTIKVSYARQSSPEIKNSNVYVAGLPSTVTEDELLALFSPFGNVLTHKLLTNPDNTSRGVGFVRYSLKSEAQNAIDSMSGKTLHNAQNVLTVKLAIPPASKQQLTGVHNSAISSSSLAAIGRGNLRFNPLAPSNQLALSQVAHLPPPNAMPLGMETSSTAALTGLLSGGIHGSNTSGLSSMIANPAQVNLNSQVFSLYVYGLQPTHTELTLYELFAPFGGILNVKLIRDLTKDDKPCKGFGFVNFRKYDEALTAVTTLNSCPFEGKNLQVSFKQNKTLNIAAPSITTPLPPQPVSASYSSNLPSTQHTGPANYTPYSSGYSTNGLYAGPTGYSAMMR